MNTSVFNWVSKHRSTTTSLLDLVAGTRTNRMAWRLTLYVRMTAQRPSDKTMGGVGSIIFSVNVSATMNVQRYIVHAFSLGAMTVARSVAESLIPHFPPFAVYLFMRSTMPEQTLCWVCGNGKCILQRSSSLILWGQAGQCEFIHRSSLCKPRLP